MEQLTDLKAILHSKRANIYYLEKCRVMQKDGRILYLTEAKNENQYWNIPIANTTCLLLGTGTSITQAAMRPATSQVDDLMSEINIRTAKNERVLAIVLTKRMAEDLTDYLHEHSVRVRYLHSDIDTVERVEIVRDLRLGEFDVLVGINLLREGLDMPEVSLVAILDADKEGFLRSERSLIQTIGRAARNLNGRAILYAEKITGSMQRAMDETEAETTVQSPKNHN